MPELLIKTLNSKVESYTIESQVKAEVKKYFESHAFVVAYLVNEVLFGKYENNEFVFPKNKKIEEKFIVQLRVFNEDKELFIRKKGNKFLCRFRDDSNGDTTECVDTDQIISGIKITDYEESDFFKIESKKSRKPLLIPFSFENLSDGNRPAIKVRNYIGYNGIMQAEYVDSRFVTFTNTSCGELRYDQ